MIQACRSEFIKFVSVRSNMVLVGLFFLFSLGGSALASYATQSDELAVLSTYSFANTALNIIGVPMMMAVCALIVTGEYKNNAQQYTLMVTPHRVTSATAKLVVASLLSGVLLFICAALSMAIFHMFAQSPASDTADMSTVLKVSGMFALSGVFISAIAQGLGYLMRNTALVVTLFVVMYNGLESLIGIIPKIKDTVSPYLPTGTMKSLWVLSPHEDLGTLPMAVLVMIVWSVLIWGAGVWVLNKRDA